MKYIILAASCAVAFAQVSKRELTHWQRMGAAVRQPPSAPHARTNKDIYRGAARDPHRTVRGKECNLRPYFAWLLSESTAPNPMPMWSVLYGKILQTTKGGVLLELYQDRVVFVKNYPYRLADKTAAWMSVVKEPEPYSYVDTAGAERSVECYDYGKPTTKIDETRTSAGAAK